MRAQNPGTRSSSLRRSGGRDWAWSCLVLLCGTLILCAYLSLHGHYRIENIDDAWYLSIARSYLHAGQPDDPVFGGNTGGVQLFGMTFAYLWGAVLDRVGWTKSAAHLLSTVTMLVGAGLWWRVARQVIGAGRPALAFLLLLLSNEAFFAAANQARPDTLTFLFVAGTVAAVSSERFFLAGLLAVLAFESHPVGIVAAVMGGALLAGRAVEGQLRPGLWKRRAALGLAGLAVGGIVYVALHWRYFGAYGAVVGDNLAPGNFLWVYYFEMTFRRHLPELAVLLVAVGLATRARSWRHTPVVSAILAGSVLASLAFPRANFHYAVLVMPGLLLFVVAQAARLRWLGGLLLFHLGLLAPQYLYLWVNNRGFDMDRYTATLQQAVPDDGLPVLGRPNAWFAFQGRTFIVYDYQRDFEDLAIAELWWIEEDTWQDSASPGLQRALAEDYHEVGVPRDLGPTDSPVRVHHLVRVPSQP
ncbi:MAG: hypothetical protein GXP62_20010 [Oligoflexia bacterium]|nr:hypothetical protein [Oligoflexia bacterium]